MTRFASPVPLRERWLERRPFRSDELEERLAWWRARERSFVERAPFDVEEPGPRLDRTERGLCELWLPVERIAREAHALLRAHFALDALDASWREDLLAGAASWLDARRVLPSLPTLPSTFLASLADPDRAEAFLFEAHDPPSYGHALDRYPEVVAAIAALAPRSAWDVGCGTGETSFALARAAGEVLGTTPSPWELLMARRRGRPHDAARTERLRAATRDVANVRFEPGDATREGPPGPFDVVFAGGLLGGAVAEPAAVEAVLAHIARALSRSGTAFVVDRFRADRSERARGLVERLAPGAGLRPLRRLSWVELRIDSTAERAP